MPLLDEYDDEDNEVSNSTPCEYAIKDVVLVDGDNNRVNNLSSGTILRSVNVVCSGVPQENERLYVSIYRNNRFDRLEVVSLPRDSFIEPYTLERIFILRLDVSLGNTLNITNIKFCIWNGVSFEPLAIPYELNLGYCLDLSVTSSQSYTMPIYGNELSNSYKISYDNNIINFINLIDSDKINFTSITDRSFVCTFSNGVTNNNLIKLNFTAINNANTKINIVPFETSDKDTVK